MNCFDISSRPNPNAIIDDLVSPHAIDQGINVRIAVAAPYVNERTTAWEAGKIPYALNLPVV
jgi:hypothetical protein